MTTDPKTTMLAMKRHEVMPDDWAYNAAIDSCISTLSNHVAMTKEDFEGVVAKANKGIFSGSSVGKHIMLDEILAIAQKYAKEG